MSRQLPLEDFLDVCHYVKKRDICTPLIKIQGQDLPCHLCMLYQTHTFPYFIEVPVCCCVFGNFVPHMLKKKFFSMTELS